MAGNIKEFLFNYSMTHREPFNEKLFIRSEMDIVKDLEDIIVSAVKDDISRPVKMGVNYFKVIDDYQEIYKILYTLETEENRRNKRVTYNKYDYIDLKESAIILLEVNYHLEVDSRVRDSSVYIAIPRIIDKYYFRISGTMYSALYQIADASTYNNSSANKKKDHSISFRQPFLKFSVYKKSGKMVRISTEGKENILCLNYMTDIFSNLIPVCKYFLAVYGLSGAMSYLNLDDIRITNKPILRDDYVCFERGATYISTPYYYWNNSEVMQSFIYTIYVNIPKDGIINLNELYTKEYWLSMLGADYKSKTVEKGLSILDSLSRNYAKNMQNSMRLPDDDKKDLLSILRWMVYQFNDLYQKDNTDMNFKKIKMSEYIASIYAAKLSYQLFGIASLGNKLNVDNLYTKLNIPYMYILNQLKKANLIAYDNIVNSNDAPHMLKYTFKGLSGIGENKSSAVPNNYRLANATHLGKVDCDTSVSDPGMTGLLCPYADIYEGGYLSDYNEPCNWREISNNLKDNYKKAIGAMNLFQAKQQLLGTDESKNINVAASMINSIGDLINNTSSYTNMEEEV